MRRRRAKTKSGQRRPAPPVVGVWDDGGGDDFPVDEIPPDELPARDINEDLEDQGPADQTAVMADVAPRGLATPEPCIGSDQAHIPSVADRTDQGQPEADTAQEPACDRPSSESAEAQALAEQHRHAPPDLFPSDPGNALHPHEGPKPTARRRRPQGLDKRAIDVKAVQLELWPDPEQAGVSADPRRGQAGRGDSGREG